MTDSMRMRPTISNLPERLRITIEDLWHPASPSEVSIHRCRAFRALEDSCRSLYLGLKGSRLARPPAINVSPSILTRALRNFFR